MQKYWFVCFSLFTLVACGGGPSLSVPTLPEAQVWSDSLAAQNHLALFGPASDHVYQIPAAYLPTPQPPASSRTFVYTSEGKIQTDTPELPAAPTPQPTPDPGPVYPQAQGFQLETQSGEKQLVQFPASQPIILAFADQQGAAQMEDWITPLYQRYTDQIGIHGIAELTAVPAFARGIAKGIIASQVKYTIMLDWTGDVSQQYGTRQNQTNIYVIDPQGGIRLVVAGAATSEKQSQVIAALDAILAETETEAP